MNLDYVDIPPRLEIADYDSLIRLISDKCSSISELTSIYQLGSIKHPGISDLDLLFVFKEGSSSTLKVRGDLSENENLILTHNIFVADESDLPETIKFGFFTNPRLIRGADLPALNSGPESKLNEELARQIALEYMLKMYISLTVQIAYGILKLRTFLLEAKAIAFDLELLEINGKRLNTLVNDVMEIRDGWFEKGKTVNLTPLVLEFHKQLEQTLQEQLRITPLNVRSRNIKVARNLTMIFGQDFNVEFTGMRLPRALAFLDRKFFSAQSRLNQFEFTVPMTIPVEGSLVDDRFTHYNSIAKSYSHRYPHFSPLTSVLPIYK